MPRLYFHLTIGDEHYPDVVGQEATDLAAAHTRAIMLADRLMSYCEVEHREPHAERWLVTIADDAGRSLMSVIVRCERVTEADRAAARQSRLLSRSL